MKDKNKIIKRQTVAKQETDNKAYKIYTTAMKHLTPWQTRRGKFGKTKPKRKDHR